MLSAKDRRGFGDLPTTEHRLPVRLPIDSWRIICNDIPRSRNMRIAIVAPLMEPVPPPLYGGTERVVSLLTDELVRREHDVTLFASGDSETSANLVACCERGLRLDPSVTDYVAYSVTQLGVVGRRAT